MHNLQLRNSLLNNLPAIATCHKECFSNSFSSKLGKAYVQKTLEWFLVDENRFLFHITDGDIVVGYCGGFVPQRIGDGSSSGMFQYAFKEALKGILIKPWLAFHLELRKYYPFLWRNIKNRIFKTKVIATDKRTNIAAFKKYTGLVVIGVHPKYRGKGVFDMLMNEFFSKAASLQLPRCILSVKQNNGRAIKAYEKYDWKIIEELGDMYVLERIIQL